MSARPYTAGEPAAQGTGGRGRQLVPGGSSLSPARHTLRRRAVAWFRKDPYAPGGAIPNAVMNAVGGPMMWSDKPVLRNQFTEEQAELVLRAYGEIKQIYEAAGGRMRPAMRLSEGMGLMPANSGKWPYQSEEWAAAKAMNVSMAHRFPRSLPQPERELAELTQAYYAVITWIDYVKGGLLDACAIYEDEPD